ncbi:MAG: hypothetical protein IPK44_25435 [Candidatus Accumulibacter sp.]|uniref:hypothetical protein n=1 Tax=Accumulibacter sp. TaxID=2053492 RepID=UPI002586FF68|nr:hypothetical protein [Accumulibacter sp.]MBK8117632.1 hypothetical protein [Accumulibacter sp.]
MQEAVYPRARDIQRQILSGLLLHRRSLASERISVMAGRLFGKGGEPSRFMRSRQGRVDLDGFSVTGKVIAIEVKRSSTRQQPHRGQLGIPLEQVKRAGGLAGVATIRQKR